MGSDGCGRAVSTLGFDSRRSVGGWVGELCECGVCGLVRRTLMSFAESFAPPRLPESSPRNMSPREALFLAGGFSEWEFKKEKEKDPLWARSQPFMGKKERGWALSFCLFCFFLGGLGLRKGNVQRWGLIPAFVFCSGERKRVELRLCGVRFNFGTKAQVGTQSLVFVNRSHIFLPLNMFLSGEGFASVLFLRKSLRK